MRNTFHMHAAILMFLAMAPACHALAEPGTGFSDILAGLPEPTDFQGVAGSVRNRATFDSLVANGDNVVARLGNAYNRAKDWHAVVSADCTKLTDRDVTNITLIASKVAKIQATFSGASQKLDEALLATDSEIKKMPIGRERFIRENEFRSIPPLQVKFADLTSSVNVHAQSFTRLASAVQAIRKSCIPLQFSGTESSSPSAKNPDGEKTSPKFDPSATPSFTTAIARINVCVSNDTASPYYIRLRATPTRTDYYLLPQGQVLKYTAMAEATACWSTEPFPVSECPHEIRQSVWKC